MLQVRIVEAEIGAVLSLKVLFEGALCAVVLCTCHGGPNVRPSSSCHWRLQALSSWALETVRGSRRMLFKSP